MYDGTYSHSLQIVFVALAQFTGDHGLGFAHIIDRALDRDDALEIETIDVVDTADRNFSIGVLHNSLDCVTALTDNPTDEIVVREDLQGNFTVDKQRNNIINVMIQLLMKQRFGRAT